MKKLTHMAMPPFRIGSLNKNNLISLSSTPILIAGMLFLFLLLAFPPAPASYNSLYLSSLLTASSTLRGGITASDLTQDVIGFRGLALRTDAYPILKDAAAEIGVTWDAPHASTHPPTTFLFAAPIAFLPSQTGSLIWGWMMLVCIGASYRLYGINWRLSLGLAPLTLLWPPASLSLGQVTPLWLVFSALAYKLRSRNPAWSGFAIGLGAMAKIFPAVLLIPALLKKKRRTVLGSVLATALFFAILLILNPAVFYQYLEASKIYAPWNAARCDNASVYFSLTRLIGPAGVVVFGLLLLALLILNLPFFQENKADSTDTWMLMNFLSVALLPLLWTSSLLPLLPVIAWLLSKGRPVITGLCLVGIITSTIFPMAFCGSAYLTAFSVVSIGSALSIWPIFSKKTDRPSK